MSSLKLKIKAILTQCGEGEIRTHGRLAPTTVFKTVPLDRSGTSPFEYRLT